MTLKEFETQLEQLSPIDKAQVIQTLMRTIDHPAQGIAKTSGVMGGDACIVNTRLPVWLFVSLRRQGATDSELLENYPQLSAADLVNVWAYGSAHPQEIEIALQEQESAMQEDL
jgi:uncharacterized protein (DUF433 family)